MGTLLSNGGGGIGWGDDANDGSVDVRCYDVATQRPFAPPLAQGSGYGRVVTELHGYRAPGGTSNSPRSHGVRLNARSITMVDVGTTRPSPSAILAAAAGGGAGWRSQSDR